MLLDLHALMWLLVATAGGQAAALVLGGGALAWFTTLQRRVQSCRLRVAALPGLYVVLLVLVGYSQLTVPQLFGLVLLVQVVLGFRKDMVGLLAFQVMPARESMVLWQVTAVALGTLVTLLVVLVGYKLDADANPPTVESLMVGMAVLEGVRLLAVLPLWVVHTPENLSTMKV
jgi:hypothetical protein